MSTFRKTLRNSTPSKAVREISHRLVSLKSSVRLSAKFEFDKLTIAEQRDVIHAQLKSYPNTCLSAMKTIVWCLLIPIALSFGIAYAAQNAVSSTQIILSALTLFAPTTSLLHWHRASVRLNAVANLIDNSEDPALIPIALYSLSRNGEALFHPLIRFLKRCLPYVSKSVAAGWTEAEKSRVLSALTHENTLPVPLLDEDLRFHALEIILYIGRWRQFQALTEVSLGFHTSTPRLQSRAAEIAPLLLERLIEEDHKENLLRSATPPTNPDSLLKIPSNAASNPELTLLRPSHQ